MIPPDDPETGALPPTAQPRRVLRMRAGELTEVDDLVVDEVPVALVYNGISHAVMMATPADLEDFALGFSLSEEIIVGPGQCYGIDVEPVAGGVAVQIEIAGSAFMALKERRRSLTGRTGCGLCGVDSLDQVCRALPSLAPARGFHVGGVRRALSAIGAEQKLTKLTGAAHAAAWCGMDGTLHIVREDVGRHNALDKVIGAMARERVVPGTGFLLITSRVSFEMAQKAAVAGVSALVGMSAPTLAAVDLADRAGLTLLAFARGNDFVCYTHAERLGLDGA
ncbi:formate dehydrogenase accessory sulfurtransferase FdhD [Telluria mixta]|uniref:Sulfur carrier protein FdhD n=1 Tax=Telluria mixta TaxID=34071 RepID=A0ABT2C5W1_9BURK|nr:formate dehydrogenase accessory sulfurtransferase FdhD [Telluria mixta]MCS0632206.1 formate dehydrogenase accessory sulfurtransferase FdhD [Telluria mixta]WEM95031.1 formate dehydrogenase accessory sulfurtransferase FdhD [Telluria mixta]